ncbi:MAG: (Fe-S)-binding protein [Deltaproteobacteria bacterium]|nr:(Fe-S)-binding protein [Deltaproteobacteria bacterium]MBW2137048.1 (Fe-S)-binding protein [Deltaproteobacteria bacterium]
MSNEVNAKKIMDFLAPRMGARFKTWLAICAHCGLCADTCHHYISSGNDPRMIPAHKVRYLREILKKKGKVDKDYLRRVYETVYYECNMCRRCALFCPFGIDIALMISLLRAMLLDQGIAPEGLLKAIENYKEFGNQMAVSREDWLETLEWCEEEVGEELAGLKIPVDKKGAEIMYTVNAREPMFYPQDLMEVAKIFHVAGEDWTLPSDSGWDDTNLAMFCGDSDTARIIVENTFKRAEELEVKKVAITE